MFNTVKVSPQNVLFFSLSTLHYFHSQTAKRRFVQAAKEKTGVAHQTLDDYAFEKYRTEFQELKPQLVNILKCLTEVKQNISGLGKSCEGFVAVSSQFDSVLSSDNDAGLFTNVMKQMEKTCNSEKVLPPSFACSIYSFSSSSIYNIYFQPFSIQVETSLQSAIDSMQLKLQPFNQIERLIKKRDGLKVDYESFKRKLDAVNEKIGSGTLSQVHAD
jgi:hypothetical protein